MLKAGDTIKVVSDPTCKCDGCIFADGLCDSYETDPCGLMFVLQKDPKQGDTVWGKKIGSDKWEVAQFVSDFRHGYVLSVPCGFQFFHEMTTTNPLEYTLTAQEALVAIGQGKKVKGDKYHKDTYTHWEDGIKTVHKNVSSNGGFHKNQMYAIVEE
jgi:hypothetical protein